MNPNTIPRDSRTQMIVALAVVACLGLLGVSCALVAFFDKDTAPVAFTALGTCIGALANALNAPTGIASVLAQAKAKADPTSPQGDPS